MFLDEFLSWLFKQYPNTFTESQILARLEQYETAILPFAINGVFHFSFSALKDKISSQWKQNRILTPGELQVFIQKLLSDNSPCEAIKKAKESRAFFEANFDACHSAMRECMAKYEAISGRKLQRLG